MFCICIPSSLGLAGMEQRQGLGLGQVADGTREVVPDVGTGDHLGAEPELCNCMC